MEKSFRRSRAFHFLFCPSGHEPSRITSVRASEVRLRPTPPRTDSAGGLSAPAPQSTRPMFCDGESCIAVTETVYSYRGTRNGRPGATVGPQVPQTHAGRLICSSRNRWKALHTRILIVQAAGVIGRSHPSRPGRPGQRPARAIALTNSPGAV